MENVVFVILTGTSEDIIQLNPLMTYNGSFSQNLSLVINRVTTLGSKIKFSSEVDLVSIHHSLHGSKEVSPTICLALTQHLMSGYLLCHGCSDSSIQRCFEDC